MGCQDTVYIGDNLTFSITTHDPDTGAVTDADAAPDYRVYEDETGVAILTGTMSKLDDANTTGFYTELVACTAANGFEDGKTYTIFIEATVDSDTGAIAYAFRAITAVDAAIWAYTPRTLTQAAAAVTAAVSGSELTITRGDTFVAVITGLGDISDRSKLWFTAKNNKGDTDAQALIQIEETDGLKYLYGGDASARSANGSIAVDDEDDGDITITLDEAETDDLAECSDRYYDIQMLTSAGVVQTLSSGLLDVELDVTRAII